MFNHSVSQQSSPQFRRLRLNDQTATFRLRMPLSHLSSIDKCGFKLSGFLGGGRYQVELPRGSNRFFEAVFAGYDFDHVDRIAEPILLSGTNVWRNRPLAWHGDNAMERINLPSRAAGGFDYEQSLILFRRIEPNTYEFRVYPWGSDSARAIVDASLRANLLFRLGRNSSRLAGFLP